MALNIINSDSILSLHDIHFIAMCCRFLRNKSSDTYSYFKWKVQCILQSSNVKQEANDADGEEEGGGKNCFYFRHLIIDGLELAP